MAGISLAPRRLLLPMPRIVHFVGTEAEVAHHAAPLRPHFDVRITAPEKIVDTAERDQLVVFFSEHFDRFREAATQLKQQHVPTLYLIDGILEWRNAWENRPTEPACPFTMRPVLSHKVACMGRDQANVLTDWGNADKVELVGAARLDGLRQRWLERNREPFAPDPRKFRLLVMTAKTPGFTEQQIETTIRSLRDLQTGLRNFRRDDMPGIDVHWRLTAGLESELGLRPASIDCRGEELAKTLDEVDAVISTPSTAMVEAMLMSKPVASLDYHACPNYLQPAWRIASPEMIGGVVEQLYRRPAERMLFQDATLAGAVELAEPGTARLKRLIESMLAISDAAIAAKDSLEFPARLLQRDDANDSNSASRPVRLEHKSVYGDYEEFGEHDLKQLQTQLAHARREVEHLKRETDRLNDELGQAHDIFDAIHSHPIAGPLVRAKQRFSRWWSDRNQQN